MQPNTNDSKKKETNNYIWIYLRNKKWMMNEFKMKYEQNQSSKEEKSLEKVKLF